MEMDNTLYNVWLMRNGTIIAFLGRMKQIVIDALRAQGLELWIEEHGTKID